MGMCLIPCYQIYLIIVIVSLMVCRYDSKRQGDKLILSPVELIDLVRKEQNKYIRPDQVSKHFELTTGTAAIDVENANTDTAECEDSNTLKSRKIWSRWSKWGECSVTCGGGTLVRQRMCVAGRCARGEREEQRRTCARAPCYAAAAGAANDIIDDNREID